MISSRLRLAVSALAIAATTLLVAGCTSSPGSTAPESSETPEVAAPDAGGQLEELEAGWLDGGRFVSVVTWGSSTCVPTVTDIAADGQTINVELADPDETACTRDLVPRAVLVDVPDGVDVTQDVEVAVTYNDKTGSTDLEALAEAPSGATEQAPAAGWFDDDGIALLTWGSSSCQPIIEGVEMSDAGATVTFETTDRVCTMDMSPRVTTIILPQEHTDGPFELTLVGDNLDGTVSVLG